MSTMITIYYVSMILMLIVFGLFLLLRMNSNLGDFKIGMTLFLLSFIPVLNSLAILILLLSIVLLIVLMVAINKEAKDNNEKTLTFGNMMAFVVFILSTGYMNRQTYKKLKKR